MYADPAKIRSHVVKIRFSDEEQQIIQALVNFTGEQRATLIRELVMEQARLALLGSHSTTSSRAEEGPFKERRRGV